METVGSVMVEGAARQVLLFRGGGGVARIELWDDEGPYATISTIVPGTTLGPDEFVFRGWSENTGLGPRLLASGLFADTGRRVVAGAFIAPVWSVRPVGA